MNVCPVLVGRDAELRSLLDSLGRGGVILVAGEAGIGKSRLLREFASRADDAGHSVVWGRPEAVTTPGPYSLVLDLLDDVAQVSRDEGGEIAELSSALEAPADGRPEPPARQIAARLRGLLGRLGRNPVVMAEDVHAADEPSQAVIAHLARSAADDGVLLIGTYRTEEAQTDGTARLLDVLARDRLASEITLRPLERDALREMLRAMSGDADEGRIDEIARLAEGIPFFIEELAGAPGQVPESVARGVLTRLQRLDEPGRAVMRAASLMPGALDPAVLADAAGVDDTQLPRILITAVRAGLLADQEGRLVFRHALVREAIADGIVSVERADLHRSLAGAIEKLRAGEIEAHAQALATHHLAAGNVEEAAAYFAMAGERALSVGATEDARAAFERSLTHGRDTGLVVRAKKGLADVRARMQDPLGAAEIMEELATLHAGAEAIGLQLEATLRLGELYAAAGDERAFRAFDDAVDLANGEGSDALRARALIERGAGIIQFGYLPKLEPPLREGMEIAARLGDPRLLVAGHNALALYSEAAGDEASAVANAEEASRLAAELGSHEWIGRTHSELAHLLTAQGKCERALALIEEARDHLMRETGSPLALGADVTRAWILWRAGMPGEAERYAGRAEAAGLGPGHPRVILAWAALERGDREEAFGIVERWWLDGGGPDVRHRETRHPEDQPEERMKLQYAFLAEVIIRVFDDRPPDEETLFLAARFNEFCAPGAADIHAMAAALDARARLNAGATEGVDQVIAAGEASLAGIGMPARRAGLAEARGLAAHVAGDPDAAMAHWREAVRLYEQAENVSDRARCMWQLGSQISETGGRDEAVGILREGLRLASSVGAVSTAGRTEIALRSLGVRPRAGRPKGTGRKEGLSPREEEVVALLAAGGTNAEIGARLFLSDRTVQDHIAKAQRRLGVNGRAGLAAWAAKQGLV